MLLDIIFFLFLYYTKTLSISCTTQFFIIKYILNYVVTHTTQVQDLHSLSSITSELNYVKSIFHLFMKMPHFNHRSMKNKNFSLEIKYLWKICLHHDWYVMEKIRKVGDPCNCIISCPMVADSPWNVNQCYEAKKKSREHKEWVISNENLCFSFHTLSILIH